MIYFLTLPFIVFLFDAMGDAVKSSLQQTLKQGRAWHRYDSLVLATLFIYIAYLPQDWLYLLYVASVRFWFFNILLNIIRRTRYGVDIPLLYLGKTSFTDKLFGKHNWTTFVAYLGSFILSILYIIWKLIN
jgi:hypothetical protein